MAVSDLAFRIYERDISSPGATGRGGYFPSPPPLGRPAPRKQAAQVPFDKSEPAQLDRKRQTLTTAGGNGTSRASEELGVYPLQLGPGSLQASPPVNAKKPERARDHRRVAAPANPRDGQADIRGHFTRD